MQGEGFWVLWGFFVLGGNKPKKITNRKTEEAGKEEAKRFDWLVLLHLFARF